MALRHFGWPQVSGWLLSFIPADLYLNVKIKHCWIFWIWQCFAEISQYGGVDSGDGEFGGFDEGSECDHPTGVWVLVTRWRHLYHGDIGNHKLHIFTWAALRDGWNDDFRPRNSTKRCTSLLSYLDLWTVGCDQRPYKVPAMNSSVYHVVSGILSGVQTINNYWPAQCVWVVKKGFVYLLLCTWFPAGLPAQTQEVCVFHCTRC